MSDIRQQELLRVEDLCERLGVCRATVFALKAKGTLRAGSEYVKIGTRVRFLWPAVLERLVDLTPSTGAGNSSVPSREELPSAPLPAPQLTARPRGPRRPALNLDY